MKSWIPNEQKELIQLI